MGHNFTPHATHPGQIMGRRQRAPHINLKAYDARVKCDDELRLAVSKLKQARAKLGIQPSSEHHAKAERLAKIDVDASAERCRIMGSTSAVDILSELNEAPPAAPIPEPGAPVLLAPTDKPPEGNGGPKITPPTGLEPGAEVQFLISTAAGATKAAMQTIADGDLPDQVKLLQIRKLAEQPPTE